MTRFSSRLFAIKKSFVIVLPTPNPGSTCPFAPTVGDQTWIEGGNSLSSSLQGQRYGRGKNSFGIKKPFDSLQPSEVATICLGRLFVFLRSQHIGITPRQRMRCQVLGQSSCPLPVSMTIDSRGRFPNGNDFY